MTLIVIILITCDYYLDWDFDCDGYDFDWDCCDVDYDGYDFDNLGLLWH